MIRVAIENIAREGQITDLQATARCIITPDLEPWVAEGERLELQL